VDFAFRMVFLPALLLLPNYYVWDWGHLPQPSFQDTVALAVGLAVAPSLFKWRFSLGDIAVLLFSLSAVASEYMREGFADAASQAYDLVCQAIIPYILGKVLIESAGRRREVVEQIVFLLAIGAIPSLWEARMGMNIFQDGVGRIFFPGVPSGWHVQLRHGFWRTAGPFGHSILAGIMLASGMLLQRWLVTPADKGIKRLWRIRWDRDGRIFLLLLLGSVLTQSRGPWLSLVLGALVLAPAWSARPGRAFARMAGFLVVIGIVGYSLVNEYTQVDRFQAESEEQSTAAYRRELLDRYAVLADRGGPFGWGRTNRPMVTGMESVDNWYLLVRLQYGEVGFWLFLLLQVVSIVRIYQSALTSHLKFAAERQFRCTLGAILVAMSFALGTVYLGLQVFIFFFLIVGWAEACILQKTPVTATVMRRRFAFERVLA
jgi:ABC-type multidrug transport system fused ATPase/permease subunit